MPPKSNITYIRHFIANPTTENWLKIKANAVKECELSPSECPLSEINNGCCPLCTNIPHDGYPREEDLSRLTVFMIRFLATLEANGMRFY